MDYLRKYLVPLNYWYMTNTNTVVDRYCHIDLRIVGLCKSPHTRCPAAHFECAQQAAAYISQLSLTLLHYLPLFFWPSHYYIIWFPKFCLDIIM